MFDSNGEVKDEKSVLKIDDIWDYNEQLRAFKAANNWDKA